MGNTQPTNKTGRKVVAKVRQNEIWMRWTFSQERCREFCISHCAIALSTVLWFNRSIACISILSLVIIYLEIGKCTKDKCSFPDRARHCRHSTTSVPVSSSTAVLLSKRDVSMMFLLTNQRHNKNISNKTTNLQLPTKTNYQNQESQNAGSLPK